MIRQADIQELAAIEAVYAHARNFMEETGNPNQWGKHHPPRETLESAIANARVKADKAGEPFRENDLYIKETYVDEGVTLKRFRARAQGRAARINKRTSHITVVVANKEGAR